MLFVGKVDKNVVQHTRPVEKNVVQHTRPVEKNVVQHTRPVEKNVVQHTRPVEKNVVQHTRPVDKNVVQHTRPVEKKTAKGVKRKVKYDHLHFNHYLDALRNYQTFFCKLNLISSTAHTVHTVHKRKVGMTAFDTKRWLCEDIVHTYGHEDTVSDPIHLVNQSFIVKCIVDAGVLSRNDLSRTSPLLQC